MNPTLRITCLFLQVSTYSQISKHQQRIWSPEIDGSRPTQLTSPLIYIAPFLTRLQDASSTTHATSRIKIEIKLAKRRNPRPKLNEKKFKMASGTNTSHQTSDTKTIIETIKQAKAVKTGV